MAGHSKWANIKHRKAAQDKKRGKIWTRIIKEITVAARDGGGDPDTNPTLRLCIQNAKGANLPKETMERAIKKGIGGEGANLEPLTYEGYVTNGVGVIVETMTDNINRTVANVRSVFAKSGGSLGTNGSLSFIFSQKGIFNINKESLLNKNKEEVELAMIEGGASELDWVDGGLMVTTEFEDFGNMQKAIENLNLESESAEIQWIPNNTVELNLEDAQNVLQTIEKFEEIDDVNNVYHNLELTDELLERLNNE